ncbi:MAG: hypothetical protein AUI14_02345 [Actinobacteria bacterium 13_2_20CM_2_71_6]|nr:MAG: hypothetical protein AUI14_02345 [Actinobacteria bacterium 13_2_20CM_2_71_6]
MRPAQPGPPAAGPAGRRGGRLGLAGPLRAAVLAGAPLGAPVRAAVRSQPVDPQVNRGGTGRLARRSTEVLRRPAVLRRATIL